MRFVCPHCENDVWQSEGDSLFRLYPRRGQVAVAERLNDQAPTDLDRIRCANCDFSFRWHDRFPARLREVRVAGLSPFESRDAIHEVRAIRERVGLLRDLRRKPSIANGLVGLAYAALGIAERVIGRQLDDLD